MAISVERERSFILRRERALNARAGCGCPRNKVPREQGNHCGIMIKMGSAEARWCLRGYDVLTYREQVNKMSVTIRAVEPTDAERLKEIYSQQLVQENMLQLPAPSLAYWQQRIAGYASAGKIGFVAELDGMVVGELVIFTEQAIRLRHAVSFGIAVDGHFSGRGIGKQLILFCQEYAFQWLAARRIELEVFADNAAAIKLYQSSGFEKEGHKRQAALKKGQYQDVILMAKLVDAYRDECASVL